MGKPGQARTSVRTAANRPEAAPARPLSITVLAGGIGGEREVSLESGRAVHAALARLGHRVRLRDITPDDLSALEDAGDFVFIALHGPFGEDGTLQAELDRRGVPYCGSGAEASARAMNKVEAKRCFERAGVPTPPYAVADRGNLAQVVASFATPAMLKPVASGSSVDTCIVRTPETLRATVGELVSKYGEALLERFIAGREFTVGILGDQALPVCEIRPAREFYDYHAKYLSDETKYLFDFDLPEELLRRMQELSVCAHQALGCAVFSRVDWMVEEATGRPFALEVNTIPGFTSHSLLPKAAARVGIEFDRLCQRIVELSLARV
ncbi:MAG TPA: D-alanine--D-alanine ligase [Phycisphaerae bacterium]|nr:D-alanine--D-alanine ligase [Phycisphaerae bacterium]HNU44710.1 D-alanine--D-alanine ligase [Phycisphaerae bacterium]